MGTNRHPVRGWRGWSDSAKVGWYTGPRTSTGCRLWQGTVDLFGYPILRIAGKTTRVTRFILGLPPRNIYDSDDLLVAMHLCDTKSCVEPSHLRAGTYAENTQDAIRKGLHRWASKPAEVPA